MLWASLFSENDNRELFVLELRQRKRIPGGVCLLVVIGGALGCVLGRAGYATLRLRGSEDVLGLYSTASGGDAESCGKPFPTFTLGQVLHSNLGGTGPDTGEEVLSFEVFGNNVVHGRGRRMQLALEVRSLTRYQASHEFSNGMSGTMAHLGMTAGSVGQLQMSLRDAVTGRRVVPDTFPLTFFDVDSQEDGQGREFIVPHGDCRTLLSEDTEVTVGRSVDSGNERFSAPVGNAAETADPHHVKPRQARRLVSLEFLEPKEVTVTLGSTPGKSDRLFRFALASPLNPCAVEKPSRPPLEAPGIGLLAGMLLMVLCLLGIWMAQTGRCCGPFSRQQYMLMGDPARDHETLEAPKAAVKAAFESRDATRYRAALREALAAKVPAQDIPMVLRVAKLPESFLPHAAREDALRLEVCFVLDCTGSMGPQKAAVCQGIQLIAKEVQELNSSKLPRAKVALSMSCVVYNDFDEKSLKLGVPVVEVFKGRALRGEHTCALSPASFNLGGGFTERPEELVKFLERGLGHGGWTPEELTGALIAASHLPWSADCRICIVVTDAPCHGKAYHDKGEDPFTDSDTGLTLSGKPEVPLRTLKERKVKFCVLHTGDNVRKMISAFKNVVPGMKDSNEVSAQTMSGLVLSWARRHLEQQPLTYSVGAFGLMELDDTTVAAANHKLLLKSSGKDVSVLTDSEGLLWVGHPRQELGEKVTIAVTRPPDAALDAQYEAVSSTVDLCDSFQGDFTAECIMPLKTLS